MNNKLKYIELCKKEKTIHLFSQWWWLDATCGSENWDVLLFEKDNEIIASWPFFKRKKYLFNLISMPKLTHKMGVWIKYPENQNYSSKLAYEKDIFNELIPQLPKYDYFIQAFSHEYNNWLPFYWAGFKQTTFYTYVIENIPNYESIINNLSKSNRKLYNKNKETIKINEYGNIDELYLLVKKTFNRQNKQVPYTKEYLKKIVDAGIENNSCKIFTASDNEGNIHSSSLILWDKKTIYCLVNGNDPEYRNSGANLIIKYRTLQYACDNKLNVDFEGSMIEPIEFFYRQLGGIQKPYFIISKINSKFLKYYYNIIN